MPCLMLNGRNYTGGGSGGAVFDGLDWDNATTLTLPDYTGYEYTPPCEGVLMSTSYGSVGGTVVKRTGYDDVFMSYRDDTWSTAWVPVTTATYTLKRASSGASYPNDSWLKFIPWKTSGNSGGVTYTDLISSTVTVPVDPGAEVTLPKSIFEYDQIAITANPDNAYEDVYSTQQIIDTEGLEVGGRYFFGNAPGVNLAIYFEVTSTTKLTFLRGWQAYAYYITSLVGIEFGGGSSVHTYSTAEHKVGTWIDGKPIYEKTYTNATEQSVSYQTWTDTVISASGIDKIINLFTTRDSDGGTYIPIVTRKENGYVQIYAAVGWSYNNITIQYTKSSS